LKKIYCGKIGFEYMHIGSREEANWLRQKIEELPFKALSKEEKITIFNRLCSNECFTNYLKNKFSTSKRFGIEGCDSMISGLDALVDRAVEHKVERIIFGMPHRGRLNTLAEVIGKKYEEILCEFQENLNIEKEAWGNTGDVKYHLGTTTDKKFPNGHTIRLSLLPNPSHLEAIDPLIQGKARATQDYLKDFQKDK
jgi:2-oxoglutarate dehydrogenase E1 component